jgi:hypothetical protein
LANTVHSFLNLLQFLESMVSQPNDTHRTTDDANRENGSIGGTPTASMGERTPRHVSRQASEESKKKGRTVHPAERRAMFAAANQNSNEGRKPMNAFRRLSRADFTSFRRASKLYFSQHLRTAKIKTLYFRGKGADSELEGNNASV